MNTDLYSLSDPKEVYHKDLLYKEDVYEIIACCFEVHRALGKGFLEAVYKDALSIEFEQSGIPYQRERKFEIHYKGKALAHPYYADFVVENKIILEIKAQESIIDENYKQIINYLAASKLKLGLLINFGENRLTFKRVIL